MSHVTSGIIDLTAIAEDLLARALSASSGRATLVIHAKDDGVLSHIILGLAAGTGLSEHDNPGEAILTVLSGRAVLSAGESSWDLGQNHVVVVPQRRHQLIASEDSVVMLTVAHTRNL